MAITVKEQLEKYGSSVYPTGRTNKNGQDVYGIAFSYDDTNGQRKRKVITGQKEQLEQKRIVFLTELCQQKQNALTMAMAVPVVATTPLAPVCTVTVKGAVGAFLKQYRPTVSPQTFLGEKTNTNNITRIMDNMMVKDITFDDFQNLVNTISKGKGGKPAAPKTVRNHIITFKKVMKYCQKKRWISADDYELITSDVKIPTYVTDSGHEEKVKEQKSLTCTEAREVLNALKSNRRYYLVSWILLLTGMRPQEFFALEKRDLVREDGYITIRQALVKQDKETEGNRIFNIGTTKNKGSRRKIPVTPVIFYYFDELEKLLKNNGSRKKSISMGNGEFVIVDRNGNLIDEHAFGVNMVRYLQRNGDCKRFTLGMPRHFYQDQLDILGANVNDVEKSVGHAIDSVAEKHYKVNEQYLKRLLPYVEQLGTMLEKAV